MKKIMIVFITVFFSALSLGNNIPSVKIGIVLSDLENPFFKEVVVGAKKRARRNGVEILLKNSDNSITKEFRWIEELIRSEIDVVIINPTDSYAVSRGIKLLNKAKIPVITIDREAKKGEVVTHIGSDNLMGGKLLAKYLIEKLDDKSQIIEIEGVRDINVTKERSEGFNSEIGKRLEVIIRKNGDFKRRNSYEIMKKILQEESNIDAVYAHNDLSALGVIDAIKETDRKILVVGFDGTPEAELEIKNKNLLATIKQKPFDIGFIAVETAIKLSKGQSVPKEINQKVELLDIKTIQNISE